MHEVQVNCLDGLSLPRKSVLKLTDRPDMNRDVYRRRKTTQQQQHKKWSFIKGNMFVLLETIILVLIRPTFWEGYVL